MENYGNDMYLSQEGYPSIDFTLLDRPSSSIVPAREPVAQFPQGDSSFPSFDLFDGAGVESFNDQSFADHGSYMLESHKDAIRRHTSGKLSAISSQRQGVHDFFDQENQPQRSGSGTWPSNEQSPYYLPGAPSADESIQRTFYLSDNYEPNSHNYNPERSSLAARMIRPPVGFTRPIGGEAMDHMKLLNVSSAMQNDARNQAMNSQRFLNPPQSDQFKPSYSMPFNSGISHNSTMDSLGYFGAQYQNQVDKYDMPNQAGVAFNNAPSHDFLGNQVPRRGPLQPSQTAAGLQFQALTRATGFSEPQSQKQLQEMFIARQLKQLEDSRQQQMLQQAQNEFSRTSYSDLLHGPDTPPSQHQTTGEIAIEAAYESQAAVLPPQNAQVSGWSADGPPSYQGFVSDLHMVQNQSWTSQMSLFGEALDSSRHSGDQNGPALSSFSEVMPQYLGGGRISPSRQQTGKSMLQPSRPPGSDHLGEIQTTNFGLGNDWNNEWRRMNQPHAKLNAVQNPQHPADSLLGHKIKGSSLSQVDVFSQSQQHFQELQLNEQRSFSFEQKQPVPSHTSGFLPQSNLSCAKSTLKNGMQQNPNSFNSAVNAAGYSSYQLDGTPFDVGASCEHPQWSTTSSSGVPLRHTIMEVGSQHQSNPWDSMLAQPHQGADFNQRPISDAHHSSWSNSSSQQVLQQGSPMLGVPPSSAKTSAVRQQEFYSKQNSLMNLRASSPGNDSNSSQKNLKAVQDCRKEISEANASHRLLQPFSEPASHSQGAWKKYTPPNQFSAGVSSQSKPLDGLKPSYGFQGQGYVNSETSFHSMTIPKKPNNASVQYDPHQDERRLERRISQDLTGGLPTANFMKTLSRQAVKMVPDVVEEVQGLPCKSAGPQNTLFEKQREVPEQQVDSCCTASISLAHLKGSQSSNSLSPQHVKLGLGPSNLSQDFQQVNETNWRSFPQIQSLDGEVPTLKSAHKTFHTGSLHGTSASEMKRTNEFEINQGSSPTINRTVLQSSATHPLVFSHRSSPASKETALFDASPPPSFASGHEMGADAVFSANATPYNPERQPSQSELGMGGDSSSGVPPVQTSTFNHTGLRDSLNGFIGKSSSISYSRQPNHNAGAMLVQNQLSNDSMRQSNYDGGGMHVVQNYHSSNMALKQLGNRAQAVNLVRSNTASKTSLLEQSKTMGSHEHEFSGIVESSRLPSNSAQEDGGGAHRDSSRLMQRTQMMLSNSMKQGEKEHSVQISFVGRQHPPDECNSQSNANKAIPSDLEASGLLSSNLHPNFQGVKSLSVSPLNGALSSSSEAGGPSQDQNKYQHSKPLNAFTLESDAVVKSFSRPPLKTPSSFDQGHSVQHMSHEGIQQRHTFEGLGPSARAARFSESAVPSVSERKKLRLGKDSPDSEFVGKWTLNQPIADARPTTGEQIARFKALQQHNVFISEDTVDKNPESVGVGHSQSPKRVDNSFVVTSKDSSLASTNSEALHQTVPYPSNPNQQSLFFAGSKQEKCSVPGNPLTPLQQSSGIKEAKFASNDDQGSKLPLGLQSSDLKEDGVRIPSQAPVSTSRYEHHLSPSKTITHSVGALHSKKRKKQLPLLIPWHIAAVQPKINLPSNSYAEELWANASNRLPEKNASTTHDESTLSSSRVKRRLLLTTESMQRLFPPLPDGLMHGNTSANNECAIYSLAKLALEDACGMVEKRNGQASLACTSPARMNVSSQGQASGMAENNALAKCVESFMERVKQLGMELARLDCSTSVSELQGETHELEKLSIVNRLAKHHGIGFTMDSSDNLFIENIFGFGLNARKPLPQKYVTAAPMPRTLPEGVRCLPL